ncbi:zinc ribbon domain-containing protein [Streptomyces olivochromogenes]|uniref:zinc ribbon domain-containing protein n=1 Tax=Streptomyces olivochromogenes TaxID=1963 RepID=UPI0036D843DB
MHVDPAYTSRTCAECGHVDEANRVSQVWFACRNCGFVDHTDRWGYLPLERSRERGGSRDIRARAWELWRRGAPSPAPAPPQKPGSGAGRKRSITASDARCASPSLWRRVVDADEPAAAGLHHRRRCTGRLPAEAIGPFAVDLHEPAAGDVSERRPVRPAVVWAGTSGRRGVRRPVSQLPACPKGAL